VNKILNSCRGGGGHKEGDRECVGASKEAGDRMTEEEKYKRAKLKAEHKVAVGKEKKR